LSDTSILSKDVTEVKRPSMYKVIFHNDDYTPWNFVAGVLVAFFDKTQEQAIAVTNAVHEQGKGLAGVYTKDIAYSKIEKGMTAAKEFGFPLRIEAEEE